MAAVPVGAVRRQFSGKARRSGAGAVHGCRLVAGWEVDVLHRDDRERRSHLAAALSGGHAGTGDLRRQHRRRHSFRARTDARSSRRSARARARCGSTIRAAIGRSLRKATRSCLSISPDGKKLYYLVRSRPAGAGIRVASGSRIWRPDSASGCCRIFRSSTTPSPRTASVWCSSQWTNTGDTPVWLGVSERANAAAATHARSTRRRASSARRAK